MIKETKQYKTDLPQISHIFKKIVNRRIQDKLLLFLIFNDKNIHHKFINNMKKSIHKIQRQMVLKEIII